MALLTMQKKYIGFFLGIAAKVHTDIEAGVLPAWLFPDNP